MSGVVGILYYVFNYIRIILVINIVCRKAEQMSDGLTDIITEIQSAIQIISEEAALWDETNFANRSEAIDFLDFYIIDRVEGLLQQAGASASLQAPLEQAKKVKLELEKINKSLFACLREKISTGTVTASSFKKMIGRYLHNIDNQGDTIGYDHLDIFINELLSDQPVPEAILKRMPGMVFYQKTPARVIFEMAERAALNRNDLFFDLGSGLGQVVILIHLLTGAAARGVEYEPAYWRYAETCASHLHLSNVQFINQDARMGDYSRGTVFFMYTPFEGSMLEEMLAILQKEAAKRVIRIFTYGPCTFPVAQQEWLTCKNGITVNPYELYEFISSNLYTAKH